MNITWVLWMFLIQITNFLTNFGPIPVELIFEHILVLILNLYYWAYLGIPKFIGPRNQERVVLAYALKQNFRTEAKFAHVIVPMYFSQRPKLIENEHHFVGVFSNKNMRNWFSVQKVFHNGFLFFKSQINLCGSKLLAKFGPTLKLGHLQKNKKIHSFLSIACN